MAYGLMLALSAPLATAAAVPAAAGVRTTMQADDAVAQQHFSALVFLQGLAAENAQPVVFGSSFSRAALGERSEQMLSSTPAPIRSGILTLSFSDNELRRWRRGAGIDIHVPDVGEFRLNLFSRGKQALRRFSLSPAGDEAEFSGAAGEQRRWALAASVDWTRTGAGRQRELVLVPQLVINAAGLLNRQGPFDICIQYAHWSSRPSLGAASAPEGRLPQAVLRWSF